MKLHGLQVSNFYNVAKIGLLEKDLAFEEVHVAPSQEDDFLKISPMGKIPVLEVDGSFICESQAILQFVEALKPTPTLFPQQPLLAGRAAQIHQFIDLYIDAPARTLLGAAFFGKEATAEQIESAYAKTEKGVKALSQVANLDKFIAGDEFSHADIAAYMTIDLASSIFQAVKADDPVANLSGWSAYHKRLAERPAFKQASADRQKALAALMG